MTIPRGIHELPKKVSDMVREMFPALRNRLSQDEQQLGVFLRGNDPLFNALKGIILARIEGRASVPEPADPVICKSMLARDRELQWLLARLEFIHRAPDPAHEDSEQPA